VVIPTTAIQRGPQGIFVYVVTAKAMAEARPVELELSLSDLSIVKRGLTLEERVVIDGQNQLRDGAKVQVLDVEGQAAARAREMQP
jgi:multidrug efflux system membrane fusion protein